jgi:putative tryptophan/tyrosine transport system substrate-binding protein
MARLDGSRSWPDHHEHPASGDVGYPFDNLCQTAKGHGKRSSVMSMFAQWVRIGVFLMALVLLTASAAWFGNLSEPPRKAARIGYLSPAWPEPGQAAFERKLEWLGHRMGKDIIVEYHFAEGDDQRLDALAAELVHSDVDVIVALNPEGARAAQKASSRIPIIFVAISDPVGLGLVRNLARPGGNVTGIANMPADLNLKRLEVLKDTMPDLHRVAFAARSANPNTQLHLASEAATASQLGLDARIYDIDVPGAFDTVFSAMARDGMQAVLAIQDSMFFANRKSMMDAALRHHLPVIADSLEYAEENALISYGIPSYRDLLERAAVYVDKILQGTRPTELPVDQPMVIELAINLKVAKELGIDIPRSMLVRANELLE